MARAILTHSEEFEWSLQGLGMLRLHLAEECRLHVWDLRYAFPGASPIHDHQQWGLHSTVLSGAITNYIYDETDALSGKPFMFMTLKAGYGCHKLHEPRNISLRVKGQRTYHPGESYAQRPEVIHRSHPVNGTVTIMSKDPTPDAENARVFWEAGKEWGSAEPRRALKEEVRAITQFALQKWA